MTSVTANVELLEIIGGKKEAVLPIETEPADIILNGFDKFQRLTGGIGVVHAQVAGPFVLGGNAEIETNGLRMSYVKIPVRFGRKTGGYTPVFARLQVVLDYLSDEIAL